MSCVSYDAVKCGHKDERFVAFKHWFVEIDNRTPGLSSREVMALQSAVVGAVRQPDNRKMFTLGVSPAFERDVLHNALLLSDAVRLVLARSWGIPHIEDFELHFQKVGEDRYKADTNLPEKLGLRIEDVHQILKASILAISEVDLRLGEMNAHNALSGFTPEELPLFRSKLDSLADALASPAHEHRFQRVIEVTGLPELSCDSRIDIEKVLKIRNEPEALEFRAWLAGIDSYTDGEIRQRIDGFNASLGRWAQLRSGKAIRLLVTTLVGVLLPPAGLGLSALDQFAWDKFVRRSGIAAFAHELYPSIFKAR